MLTVQNKTETHENYTTSEVQVNVPAHDTDITLVLPNGKKVCLEWRVESVSLDICLPEKKHLVTCWEGEDMKPAKAYQPKKPATKEEADYYADGHVRKCGQLIIDFGEKYLG